MEYLEQILNRNLQVVNAGLVDTVRERSQETRGLGVRNEIVRLGDGLYRESSQAPALVTQIKGPGGLIEFARHLGLLYTQGARLDRQQDPGIVRNAPLDAFSFTVHPHISYWNKIVGSDVFYLRGGWIMPEAIDLTKEPDARVNQQVLQYVLQLANDLMDAVHGKQNWLNGWYIRPGVQKFHTYNYSMALDPGLTERVIDAFNLFLPAKGIDVENALYHFQHPEDGMPFFRTELRGKCGTVRIRQEYVIIPTVLAEAHKGTEICALAENAFQIATFPFISFERPGRQEKLFVAPDHQGPVRDISSQELVFDSYQDMAKQLLALASGSLPKPIRAPLKLASG